MTDADVTEIAIKTMMVGAKVAAPILLTALLVGVLIVLLGPGVAAAQAVPTP